MRHLLLLISFITETSLCSMSTCFIFYITKWFTLPQKNKYKIIFPLYSHNKGGCGLSSHSSCYLWPDNKQCEQGRVYACKQFTKGSSHTVSTFRNRADRKLGHTIKIQGPPLCPASSSRTSPPSKMVSWARDQTLKYPNLWGPHSNHNMAWAFL